MEQLFAVRVLVHYHDKSNVDHAAVRRLLSAAAVDSLLLLLADGTSVSLSSYIQSQASERKPIVELVESSGSSLIQVASVFMLAEARAAVDSLPSSPQELEIACSALERLLGCLATKRPLLPVRDIKQSARVKFGTAARRRAAQRSSTVGSDSANQEVSILKAVNAILRLCDVATHCLAVVARQSVGPKSSCETAVALSTRLLTLAASLYEVQKADTTPALSFFSSNSLRTSLVAGAMHLGSIVIEHFDIEPMTWIHVANRIVVSSSVSVAPRTSVLSALFGGMIKAGKRYEFSERDTKAAEAAVCLLSTLHVVLETDIVRGPQGSTIITLDSERPCTGVPSSVSPVLTFGTGAISQAARSFLGERVVAAEEDGDEGRIAARTVYQACEEYAERAGESDGMMGLLSRLFASAGRQCRLESADESVVSISENALANQPDESDASSDGPHVQPESPPFTLDIFDQRSRDGFGAGMTTGSGSEGGLEHAERIDLHREVGALALDTLAHWVTRAQNLDRYSPLNMSNFTVQICRSASCFSLSNSSASYDLRAAMIDFGSLIGPDFLRKLDENYSEVEREEEWRSFVEKLVGTCCRMNPILRSILSCNKDNIVVTTLLEAFIRSTPDREPCSDTAEVSSSLPVDSILIMLMSLTSRENGLQISKALVQTVMEFRDKERLEISMSHRASVFILLSHAILAAMGIYIDGDKARIALISLHNRDSENNPDPIFPTLVPEMESLQVAMVSPSCTANELDRLVHVVSGIGQDVDKFSFRPRSSSWERVSKSVAKPLAATTTAIISSGSALEEEKQLYHIFWSYAMLHKCLMILSNFSRLSFCGFAPSDQVSWNVSVLNPFVCMKALESESFNHQVKIALTDTQESSISSLYTAECLAMLHPQSGRWPDRSQAFSRHPLQDVLTALVRNTISIASMLVYEDIPGNFASLLGQFSVKGRLKMNQSVGSDVSQRSQFHTTLSKSETHFACLQLAMSYIRDVGTGRIPQLLAAVMVSAKELLSSLTPTQLYESKDLLLEVATLFFFLPDAFESFEAAIAQFLKQYLVLLFRTRDVAWSVEEVLTFIGRVAGVSKIVEQGSSVAGMHLMCKFANDISNTSQYDVIPLQVSLLSEKVPNEIETGIRSWLDASLPRASLSRILTLLLIPQDDSAVAVSAHSRSLCYLTQSCERSELWQDAVLRGWNECAQNDTDSLAIRMVRRSVMQSATMNDSFLALVEKVVGKSSSPHVPRILRYLFSATCKLFEEEEEVNLEGRVRLLHFAVRLCICYGRSSRNSTNSFSPPILENELFDLVINSLARMTKCLNGRAPDPALKHIVLFLCGLIDCFLVGIYGNRQPYFPRVTDKVDSRGSCILPDIHDRRDDQTEEVETTAEDDGEKMSEADRVEGTHLDDAERSSLCTYTTTGSQFVEQHWYFCYSCDLAGSEGVCAVCARTCHSGCELAYSKFSRFFCDCGAGSDPQQENASNPVSASEDGDRGNGTPQEGQSQSHSTGQAKRRKMCKCLKSPKPKEPPSSSPTRELLHDREAIPIWPNSTRDLRYNADLQEMLVAELASLREESEGSEKASFLAKEAFEVAMNSSRALGSLVQAGLFLIRELDVSQQSVHTLEVLSSIIEIPVRFEELRAGPDFCQASHSAKLAQCTKLLKSGTVDTSGVESDDKTSLVSSSMLSYSSSGGILAVGHRTGFVEFIDSCELDVQGTGVVDKNLALDYARASVPFDVLTVRFHPENQNFLLLLGTEKLSVLCRTNQNTENPGWNQVEVELGLSEFDGFEGSNTLLDASWIEGGPALVLVTTANFVKIFDVSSDTFCPRFYSKVPSSIVSGTRASKVPDQLTTTKPDTPKIEIIKALVVPFDQGTPKGPSVIFVFLVTSEHKLFVSASREQETEMPHFSFLCDVRYDLSDGSERSSVLGLCYHPADSLITVIFENGSVLCLSISFHANGPQVWSVLRWARIFRDVVTGGIGTEVVPIPGRKPSFLFSCKGQTLKSGGVFAITTNRTIQVHSFSGSPSAAVLGMTTYAGSMATEKPLFDGGFFLLNDGSLHRIDLVEPLPRTHMPEDSALLKIVERLRLRTANHLPSDSHVGYNAVPETVGFFEKCRLVADQVSVERISDDSSPDSNFERMGVTLAGGGTDCVVSRQENCAFKFEASIENESIVLVGARLRFGGTDRSRHRVPSEVKVFGRTVKWHSRNGVKRWLDIPFSVPESTESPQKVSLELLPRRSVGEGRSVGDGLVAIDAIELYAVSSIEFTERKLLFEKEKSSHFERLKAKKESSDGDSTSKFSDLGRFMGRPVAIPRDSDRFTPDQAGLLTVLQCIGSGSLTSETRGDALLLEINNLWSALFEGSPSRDPRFLAHLLKPCLRVCRDISQDEFHCSKSPRTITLAAEGMKHSLEGLSKHFPRTSMLYHIDKVERALFAVAGFARALLISGCSVNDLSSDQWARTYFECMPDTSTLSILVRSHLDLGSIGRSLYKSSHGASANAVDILIVNGASQMLKAQSQGTTSPRPLRLLVQMMSSIDQRLRLFSSQRFIDVLDAPQSAAQLSGSPFESILANALSKGHSCLRTPEKLTSSLPMDPSTRREDSESVQRWAYRCDSCGEVCDQEWWHCKDCEDFDLCTSCLRKKNPSFDGPHEESHLLLRGSPNDDSSEPDQAEGNSKEVSGMLLTLQEILVPLIDEFLLQLFEESDSRSKWRFVDEAEAIAQIVGQKSAPELRVHRLEALFQSSFPLVLKRQAEELGEDIKRSCGDSPLVQGLLSTSEGLFFMLRILLSAKGSITLGYIHKHGIPGSLFSLLEKMHEKLQLVIRAISSGQMSHPAVSPCHSILSWSAWNKEIPRLEYSIMPQKSRRKSGDVWKFFDLAAELGTLNDVFLNVLIATLDVLEYSLKSASSSAILEQMRKLPRNVLCDIINFSKSTIPSLHDVSLLKDAATAATRVLSALSFDDRHTLNDTLDKYMYEEQSNRLKRIMESFLNKQSMGLEYETAVEVATILQSLHKAAERHPSTWRSFVIDREDVLHHLYAAAQSLDGKVQVYALQLLASGVAVSPEIACRSIRGNVMVDVGQVTAANSPVSPEVDDIEEELPVREKGKNPVAISDFIQSCRNNRQVCLSIFKAKDFEMLRVLVHKVMLKSLSRPARRAASQTFVLGIARAAGQAENEEFVAAIHTALLKGVKLMPYAGDLADGLMDCLSFFIMCCQGELFGLQSEPLLTSMASAIASLLKTRCGLLISHPNARLYGRLSNMLDIHGYYMESDPCMSCSASICEASEMKEFRLDTIRAETKYTDVSIMHRLLSSHEVSTVSVKVIDPRRSRRAKRIDVFYSSRSVSDAAELKSSAHPWRKLRSIELGPLATESCVDLIVPIAAANVKFVFVDFHTFADAAPASARNGQLSDTPGFSGTAGSGRRSNGSARGNENLQCPRCSRSVSDRHGICRNCHENAYQCRQCRNINYENLDGFLCNECGYCKHGRFEFSVTGRPTFVSERIMNEEDRKRASKVIEKETGNVHRCMDQLTRMRSSIIRSLNSGVPSEDSKDRTRLLGSARIGLADLLDTVAPRTDIAVLEALLEGQSSHEMEEAANSTQGGISITEEVIAESSGSADPSERDQNNPTSSGLASPVNRTSRHSSQPDLSIVSKSTTSLAATYAKDCRSIYASMSRGIRILTLTRAELVRYANTVGGSRLQYSEDIGGELNSSHKENDLSLSSLLKRDAGNQCVGIGRTCCYGCTQSFISKCVRLVQTIMSRESTAASTIQNSDLAKDMMLVCSLCEKSDVRSNIRELITYLVNGNLHATQLVCKELAKKIEFCIDSFETIDAHSVSRFEMAVLETTASLDDSCWEDRLRLVVRILFKASSRALTCSSVAESIILPCLRVALRLMRADSELTLLEKAPGLEGCGSSADPNSRSANPLQASDNSETEHEDVEPAVQAAISEAPKGVVVPACDAGSTNNRQITGEVDAGDAINVSSVQEALNENTQGTLMDADSTASAREQVHMDDRRQNTPRGGSDLMPGSGAPSSVGTTFDDDNGHGLAHPNDVGINIHVIRDMLEGDHDSKLLSADVGQWLEGRINQSSWIAEMKARTAKGEQKGISSSGTDLSSHPKYLTSVFQGWKRYSEKRKATSEEARTDEELETQKMKRLSIEKDNWIVRLMLFTPCATVRKEACALLQLLCGQEEALTLQLLDVLTGPALSLGADVGEKSKEYFDLLESTLSTRSHRLYLIAKGFLPRMAEIIRSRAERLILAEANSQSSLRLVNFLEGYSLKRLLALLRQTLEVIPSQRAPLRERLFMADNFKLVTSLQRAYICVRKLISLRTRLTDECGSKLSEVLLSREFLFSGPTIPAVVSACVSELKSAKQRNDAQAIAILLDQLCQMLCPERKEPICYLSLNKAPTQEEFIRGSMSRNPYPSSSFDGPLMRDVKNKICKDLDLPGLLEDDFAMELLVAGNLVKLDLPIMAVFDHVWRGSSAAASSAMHPTHVTRTFGLRRASPSHSRGRGSRNGGMRSTILTFRRLTERDSSEEDGRTESRTDPPMNVVYRLSGLDGEATEPIVDSVPTDRSDEQDVEDLYRDTIIFGEVGGLEVLFKLLAIVGSWGDDAETAVRAPALRLLRASCEVAQNRALLAKSADAVRTLLDCAASAFEHAQGSPTAVISAESLLIAAEQILAQQRKILENDTSGMSDTVSVSSDDPDEVMSRVRVFLGRLSVATWPKAENSILHLLPFLIQGVPAAIDVVLEHFYFSCESIDSSEEDQKKAKQLGTVLFATPSDVRGGTFAEEAMRREIGKNAVGYVVKKFPVPRSDYRCEWDSALECCGPPLILRVLTGLSRFLGVEEGRQGASALLREVLEDQKNIIPVLCQLEMAVSDNAIGSSAEELLEALAQDQGVKNEIESEREAIKKSRREAARASRIAILRESGLTGLAAPQSGLEEDVRETEEKGEAGDLGLVQQLLAELPEEVGPACVVCGDGFRCRPEDALGFYVFCRKVPLDLSLGAIVRTKGGPESGGSGISGSSRVDLDLWSSGRSRSGNGLPSKSGSNSCYTTVTHLNAIHLSCHKEAARVDRTSRRDEWDGASLRNSQTRCNNLFPVRPPASFKEEENSEDGNIVKSAKLSFSAAVDGYFGRLSSLGRTSLPHAKGVTYDLGRSLVRFADGRSGIFSEYAKGGGPHSNACLIPHLVQLGIYMIEIAAEKSGEGGRMFENNSSLQTQEAAVRKYLDEDEVGDISYYLACALVLQTLREWDRSLVGFLRRGLKEKVVKCEVVYKLIAFSDLVNRSLKRHVVLEEGQHWLDALRKHIGGDESFPQDFGDLVNERWESYIRGIGDGQGFMDALKKNYEVVDSGGEEKNILEIVDEIVKY